MSHSDNTDDTSASSDLSSNELFYNHLTLGLSKTLAKQKGVHTVNLHKREPTEKSVIANWEQKHCCKLPNDLKNFYLSVEGFKMEWEGEYGGETFLIGAMEINPITKLRRIGGFESLSDGEMSPNLDDLDRLLGKRGKPLFKSTCKIFELQACPNNSIVCLVYLEYKVSPSIWLLDRSLEWHFIAKNFTLYFRMMLVYHGFPEWQYALTPIGLSPAAKLIISGIAPELLSPPSFKKTIADTNCRIDPTIFKVRSKMKSSATDERNASGQQERGAEAEPSGDTRTPNHQNFH
ncbi:tubulin polyglutamylase complex subunit 2 isoform X1 [Rhodnius prolixus]|uniref:tubulin polyglutamylase complex subunit 2 isoform X1 n=1 Tax=Rhodnius prolixus TaxID=13249 RepID=UPI003D18E01B